MAYELKEGQGSLFRNERKQQDNHPDHTGSLLLNGIEYRVAAWVKTSKDGSKKFFNLSVKPKEDRPARQPVNGPASSDPDPNDEIPF